MVEPLRGLDRLAVHTQTHRPWSLQECVRAFAARGIPGISIWRHTLEPRGALAAAGLVRSAGLAVPALVRGGLFAAPDAPGRARALDDNRRAVEEAHTLGAEMVVLVVGAVPGMPLEEARAQVRDGVAALLPDAAAAGVRLAIEPMHPMYAADKSCINRMAEARALWAGIDHPSLGVAVDVYHVWWDPDLRDEIRRAGAAGRLFGFHVCDWRVDTRHLLTDRGIMGEGCIPVGTIRGWMEEAGFDGYCEVEVFSEEHWARDQERVLDDIVRAFGEHT